MYLLAALQYEDPTIVRKPASPISRPRKATCRSLKTKCLPGDAGPTGCCSRCARLGIECEYLHQLRGPRKGSRRSVQSGCETPSECVQPPKRPSRDAPIPEPAPARKRRRTSPLLSPPSSASNYPSSSIIPLTPSLQDTPAYHAISPATTQDGAQTLTFLAPEIRTTLDEYLDSPDDTPKQPPVRLVDAVGAGLLTECDACFLFRRFEQQISPSSHLFDPGYHTYDRVRASVPLFNAIMYASARFFTPHLADALFATAVTMIQRSLQLGTVDITVVQALLVLVYWKKPKDPTAYHNLGLATRLMCQLRVKWDFNPDPMPLDEERARVDAERTAFNAFNMDSSYSMMLRLPVMPWSLPNAADLMRWATAHRHLNTPGDYFKVFVTECWELQRGMVSPGLTDRCEIVERISAMTEKWDKHPCLTGVLRCLAQLLGKTFLLKAYIVAAREKSCISIACVLDDISVIIRHLKVSGEAVFLNDLSASMLSTPAVIVYNGRNDFDPNTMACAAAFVRDMADLFRTLPSNTPEDHALRYVQRCYLRVDSALDRYTAGLYEAHDNIVGQLHDLLADTWPALAFSPEEAITSSVLDPSWLASMQFM